MKIFQVNHFVNDEGYTLTTKVLVDGKTGLPLGMTMFTGEATVNMQTPQGVQQVPLPPFVISAESLQEAFEAYPKAAEQALEEFKKEYEAQRRKQQLTSPLQR